MSSSRKPNSPGHVDPGLDGEGVAGRQRRRVAGDDVRVLVLLDPDAVPGPVDEPVAPAGRRDARAGLGVDGLARRADRRRRARGALGVVEDGVDLAAASGGGAPPVQTQRVMSEQ